MMNIPKWISLWLLFVIGTKSIACAEDANETSEKPIVVVIPSYNNIKWYVSNLDSVLMQKYSNYRVIYVDDCSSDGMSTAVEEYVKRNCEDYRIVSFDDSFSQDIQEITQAFIALVNQEVHQFTLVHNVNRCGALENLYRSIHSCQDEEIVATLDGDDWLANDGVLKKLNSVYSLRNIWLTHGTLKEYPFGNISWCEPVPVKIVQKNAFREFKCPSHLRTFYAWLFKKIRLEDLLYEGKFYPMTWDMAMMYPMIEMAGERHFFIAQVNYIYNMANQINDNKVNPKLQNELDRHIRALPRYQRLQKSETP